MFSSSSNNVRNVGDVSLSLFCFFAPLYHVYKQTRQQTMRLNSLTIAFVVRANRINTDYLIIEFRYNPTDGFLMWERVFADLIIHNLQNIDYCQRMRWLIEARKLFQTLASYVQPTYHPSSNLRNCISVSKLNQLDHHIDLLRHRTVWLVANYRLVCSIFHLERLCVTFANTPVVYRLLYLFIFLVSDLYSRNEEVTWLDTAEQITTKGLHLVKITPSYPLILFGVYPEWCDAEPSPCVWFALKYWSRYPGLNGKRFVLRCGKHLWTAGICMI